MVIVLVIHIGLVHEQASGPVHVESGVADLKSLHDDNLGYAKLCCNT
jgi:hypothetical protein